MTSLIRRGASALPPVRRLLSQRDKAQQALAEAEHARRRAEKRARKLAGQRDRLRAQREELSGALAAARAQTEEERRRGDLLSSQVAARDAAEAADPGDLGYLFVVTYGRSGSTLLQGILNAIPGYLIRGENGGALYQLYRYHRSITDKIAAMDAAGESSLAPTHPWFGLQGYPAGAALATQRALALQTLLRPEPGTRVTGFKEVRWNQPDVADFIAYLRELFPGARFLVNTRNLDDVAKSKWWGRREDADQVLGEYEGKLLALLADLGPAGHRVHYDDYVADPATLAALFAWLGEDFDLGQVQEVMATRHSY